MAKEPNAREMAAAPQTAPTTTTTDARQNAAARLRDLLAFILAENLNPFEVMITSILFKPANDGAKTYDNERDGSKSKKIANVILEFAGTGGYLKGSIYAVLPKGKTKPHAECKFFGANMQTAFAVEDPANKPALDAFRAHVANKYAEWAASNKTTHAATAPAADLPELDGISL